MKKQWHPLFAQLLRPLLESHYEVQTNVAVGDAPRLADVLLLRRTSASPSPFQGLWQRLTTWNVLEFKGPTVTARVDDLDALLEVGLGIHRRLNEERAKQRQAVLGRAEVSFWYLANHLGRRFLRSARGLVGELTPAADGLWRAVVWQRPFFLASNRELAVEPDSLPVHLLTAEAAGTQEAVAEVLRHHSELLPLYAAWLAGAHPALLEEVKPMGRRKTQEPFFKVAPLIKHLGWQEVLRQTGVEELIDEVGAQLTPEQQQKLIEKVGLENLVARLTPEQRQELLHLLQGDAPAGRRKR